MSSDKNTLIILGSGPCGISVAKELIKSKFNVYMIDCGFDKAMNIESSDSSKQQLIQSPKFKVSNNKFAYSNYEKMNNLKTKNFTAIGSLATGGLSNIWGGGIDLFTQDEFLGESIKFQTIEEIYNELFFRITGESIHSNAIPYSSHSSNYIDNDFLDLIKKQKESEVQLRMPMTAVNYRNVHLKNFKKNNGIYNSGDDIKNLNRNSNFTYLKNRFVKKISKTSQGYKISFDNLENNKSENISSKFIFCSLGTLSTTRIVMDLLGIQEASLPTTPSGYYLGFSKSKKNKKDIIFGLPALDYSIKTNGKKINGSLFRFNSDYIDIAISEKSKQLKFFLKKYFSHFLEHFYIGNIYFSSEYSMNKITLGEEFVISGKNTNSLQDHFNLAIKNLKKELKKAGVFILFSNLFNPGQDIHYGSTIPCRKNPKKLQCNLDGELYNHRNFYITDSSSLPSLPGKRHTFTSMAHSTLIARKFLRRIKE